MNGKITVQSANDASQPVLELKPEVVIRGQPMEVISVVEDGHGVIWVNVEPVERRRQRVNTRRKAAIQHVLAKVGR